MIVHYPTISKATASRIRVDIPVDSEDLEEGGLEGCPALTEGGTRLVFTVDVDSGRAVGWTADKPVALCVKARDEGVYTLLDPEDRVLASREDQYVPDCIPSSYGDYVICTIHPDGRIDNEDGRPWTGPDVAEVQDAFWPTEEE